MVTEKSQKGKGLDRKRKPATHRGTASPLQEELAGRISELKEEHRNVEEHIGKLVNNRTRIIVSLFTLPGAQDPSTLFRQKCFPPRFPHQPTFPLSDSLV
jgi:hypothetical protein